MNTTVLIMNVKCVYCHAWKPPTDFMSNDRNVKTCKKCREKKKDYREEHTEKLRKQRKVWREVNAEQRHEYDKTYREDRKIFNPLNTKFKQMIRHSIQADTNSKRSYEPPDYIDEPYLNYLWNDQDKHCFHCNCIMTLDFNANPNKVSIQRLNNDLPHIKTNCVLACFLCNVSHRERTAV